MKKKDRKFWWGTFYPKDEKLSQNYYNITLKEINGDIMKFSTSEGDKIITKDELEEKYMKIIKINDDYFRKFGDTNPIHIPGDEFCLKKYPKEFDKYYITIRKVIGDMVRVSTSEGDRILTKKEIKENYGRVRFFAMSNPLKISDLEKETCL